MKKNNYKTSWLQFELLNTGWRFIKTVYERFFEVGCTYRSAALTYTTLLSLVPLMTVSFAVFAAFPVFSHISGQIQNFIFSHFVAASGEVIQTYLQKFVSQTKNLSAIGSAFLFVTAILMMFTMEQAFNAIWKVDSRRKGVSTFLMYWAILTLSPILIGVSIIVSGYLSQLPIISSTAQSFNFLLILPFLLNLIFFTLLYVVVPNCYVPVKHGFTGALVASILFSIAKWGFGYYVSHFPTYILLYGALATIPLFLVWLYVMWIIILFGVIISNVLTNGYRFRSTAKLDGFTHGFIWMGYFKDALMLGKSLALQDLINLDNCGYQVEPRKQLQLLLDKKLITQTQAGHYILSADLSDIRFEDYACYTPWRVPRIIEIEHIKAPFITELKEVIEHKTFEISLKEIFTKDPKP